MAARRLAPRDARVRNEIGNVLHNSFGRIADALSEYEEARRLDPRAPAAHHNAGLMLMRLGRHAEAVAPLEEALRLNPAYASARHHLSNAYSFIGRYAEAADSWGELLESDARDSEALHGRAWNYTYAGGRGAEAAAAAREFLQVAGWRDERAPFMALLAHLGYRQAGQGEEAHRALDEAAEKTTAGAWSRRLIGYMRGEIGADELLALADDNGKKTEAHAYIGMNLLLGGEREAARRHFEWVKEYGNKRFLEFPLAVAELKRIGG